MTAGAPAREAAGSALPRIWVDTDVALGAASGDVDDGFALAAVLGAEAAGKARLLGISTVHGNTSARESARCASALAASAGRHVEVVEGAAGPGRGVDSPAAARIAALASGADLLCLGPLTNVAAACDRDAGLPDRVVLRVVGGRLVSRGFLPPVWPWEFNLARDAAAARRVLSRPWRAVVLYPLDVVRRLRADAALLGEISKGSPSGRLLAEGSRRWLARARRLRLSGSFALWDAVAALDAVGALERRLERRPLASAIRRYLRLDAPFTCLVEFEAERARRALLDLLGKLPP
jgi:inosine-uridine nucleoside N-ribohydrolase